MKHTECKDCKLREGDCGHHFEMNGITDYDIASQSACDKYYNCMFFQPKGGLKMRLIDADAFKKDLRQYFTEGVLDGISAKLAFNQILHDIDNAPTVCGNNQKWCESCVSNGKCASTRPTGKWLDERFVAFHLTCDNCGCNIRREKTEVFEGNYNYNFCPNCGAKMKGEEE